MPHKILIYDGSFKGLFTLVFQIYEEKILEFIIQTEDDHQPAIFGEIEKVYTDDIKADRVLKAFKKIAGAKGIHKIYRAFLSEIPGIEIEIVQVIKHIFLHKTNLMDDFSYPPVLNISKTDRKVGREKHRMEAFIRFEKLKDDLYYAKIAPDFNVLPLISKHFKDRYADQKWLIYDEKRKFGIFYDLNNCTPISLDFDTNLNNRREILHNDEIEFQNLWKSYFKSTNIKSRKNSRLHLQHVPKRYWKFLTEKTPFI